MKAVDSRRPSGIQGPGWDQKSEGEKLKELSQDFESMFLELMLRTMRQSIPKSGLVDGGNAEDIYRSMLDAEYAKEMARQDFTGIAKSLEKQMGKYLSDLKGTQAQSSAISAYREQKFAYRTQNSENK